MTDNTLARRRIGKRSFMWFALGAVVLIFLYTLLYQTEPFSPFANNLISNLVTITVAGLSALLATFAAQRYEPTDQPRRIWNQLAIGLWGWTVGEVVWAIYNVTVGEVGVTIGDLFWILSYGFFGYALLIQYRLVFQADQQQVNKWALTWLSSTLTFTLVLAWVLAAFTGQSWGVPLLVAAFYPIGDFVIAIVALRIVSRFRGGALGYPWLGLFAFAFADMLYAILEMSGAYTWSVTNGNLLSSVADISYVAAYLFVALGCYAQLLLLKHGPFFTIYKYRKAAG